MDRLPLALRGYSRQVSRLANAASTTESTYYPAIRDLLAEALAERVLPFEARCSTSEAREGGGADQPDFALYDGPGGYPVVLGEAKLPEVELKDLAVSTERNDQIGRYLAKTRVVILCNVRGIGLLTVKPGYSSTGPVPPKQRELELTVDLWPSPPALKHGKPVRGAAAAELAELVERAVTRYAPIAEPESLARILARFAKDAKEALPAKFSDAVRGLLDDFGEALGIKFQGTEGEAFLRSSLVQTAFYGLFAGWCLWRQGGKPKRFRWEDLSEYLRIPFLGSLFHEFRHPKRIEELRLAEHLDRATEALFRVDEGAFFARFRLPSLRRDGTGDPGPAATTAIAYFYEPFLEAFDPDLRKELGVWYTPPEIVRYQVRRIDQLLRAELGCERGFADENVVVLDPCCGTGAYLVEVLQCIADQLASEGAGATLGAKLLDALGRRVLGFEILTAPFVIAQLQAYLVLADVGAEPDPRTRPAIFLTNALTGWDGPERVKFLFPELKDEHDAAQRVKRGARIIVVLGNPPYNRFAGVPIDDEQSLVDHYKGLKRDAKGKQLGETELYSRWGIRKHLLDDLYIRFFRLAEKRIGEHAEYGVVSYISNSSYLTGRSHPIMRESLLRNFQAIWIDNLHGNRLASERTPWGDSCETIFHVAGGGPGIKVGTCIATFLKRKGKPRNATSPSVWARDFWGVAEKKRAALLASLEMATSTPTARKQSASRPEGPREYEKVVPTREARWRFASVETAGGFEEWPGLDELFPTSIQGVNPNRGLEGSIVETDRAVLERRMKDYFSAMPQAEFAERHPAVCEGRADYRPAETRKLLRREAIYREGNLVRYLLFPLDLRWIYYDDFANLLNRRRPEYWDNLEGNEFLAAVPQPRRISEARPLVCTTLADLHLHDRGSVLFPATFEAPVERVKESEKGQTVMTSGRLANLAPSAWRQIRKTWGLSGEVGDKDAATCVRDLFRTSMAILHAPGYEADHGESLAHDWAHVPIPRSRAVLERAAAVGDRVAKLLDPALDPTATISSIVGVGVGTLAVSAKDPPGSVRESDLVVSYSYYGAAVGRWLPRKPELGEFRSDLWGDDTGDLWLNEHVFLRHVPRAVWQYELGGYRVVKKWLGYRDTKRRGGRPLSLAELDELRAIVHRLAALLLLRPDLDKVYEAAAADAFSAEELGLHGS